MRFLLDQCLPRSAVDAIEEGGHQAVHCSDCGLSRALDQEILEYARREEYVVVTLDADFHHLLALTQASAPSVIRIRGQGMMAEHVAEIVCKITQRLEEELAEGIMVSASEDQIRTHVLPIDVNM